MLQFYLPQIIRPQNGQINDVCHFGELTGVRRYQLKHPGGDQKLYWVYRFPHNMTKTEKAPPQSNYVNGQCGLLRLNSPQYQVP